MFLEVQVLGDVDGHEFVLKLWDRVLSQRFVRRNSTAFSGLKVGYYELGVWYQTGRYMFDFQQAQGQY